MKKFLLLVIFFVFAIYSSYALKLVSRSLTTESVQLQLEYLGSCDHFTTYDSSRVQFSKPTNTCLPIKDNLTDIGNLQADYFCSDIGPSRSIIHFVEVYELNDQVTENSFVFSMVSSRPFRAHVPVGSMAYSRRPDCTARKTFCTPTTLFVDSCSQNKVTLKKKYVLNSDRVYVAVNTNIGDTCKDILTCCTYVSASLTTGICPSTAPNSLNRFPKKQSKPQHYEDEHDRHDNDRHDDDRHDNDRYENDRHDNNRHGNDRHDNDRHDNNRHGNDRHDNNRHGNNRDENDNESHQNNKKVEEETESVHNNNQKENKEEQVKENDNQAEEEKKRNIN